MQTQLGKWGNSTGLRIPEIFDNRMIAIYNQGLTILKVKEDEFAYRLH